MSLLKAHMNKWPKCQNGKKNFESKFYAQRICPPSII